MEVNITQLGVETISEILLQKIETGLTAHLDDIKKFLKAEGGQLSFFGGNNFKDRIDVTTEEVRITLETNDLDFVRAAWRLRKWKKEGRYLFCHWAK